MFFHSLKIPPQSSARHDGLRPCLHPYDCQVLRSGKSYSLQYLREHCFLTREGVSLLGISDAAERIGMKIVSADTNYLFRKIESEFVKNQSPKFG